MKHYILICICAALITLLFTLSFKFTPYQTLILYFVMLTSFEIRNFIDNYKKTIKKNEKNIIYNF